MVKKKSSTGKKKTATRAKKKKSVAKKKVAGKKDKSPLKQSSFSAQAEEIPTEKNKEMGQPNKRAEALMGVWRKGGDSKKSVNSGLKKSKLTHLSGQQTAPAVKRRITPVITKPGVKEPAKRARIKPDIMDAYLHNINKTSIDKPRKKWSRKKSKREMTSIEVETLGSGVVHAVGNGLGNIVSCGKYTYLGVKFFIKDGISVAKSVGKTTLKILPSVSKKE